jgi:hypothetical protein
MMLHANNPSGARSVLAIPEKDIPEYGVLLFSARQSAASSLGVGCNLDLRQRSFSLRSDRAWLLAPDSHQQKQSVATQEQ